jgi:RNA polymerase sigma-70 factor (ECF subfamily)
MPSPASNIPDHPEWFLTTRWSVVLRASGSDAEQNEALEQLCRAYWPPLYAFLRREGYPQAEAEDIVQGFFERFVAKDYLRSVHPDKGRFRSFLLASLKHFASNVRRDARTARRGGSLIHLDVDDPGVAARCEAAAQASGGASVVYDRVWAETVMERAAQQLRAEYTSGGRAHIYERIRGWLAREARAGEYAAAGKDLGMSEGAVAVAVHRLRQRYRQLVRTEVAQTVPTPAEVDDEMRYLLEVLTSR